MKKVLSLLLVFVLLKAQAMALSGGPVFPGGTAASYIGVYSGIFVPLGVTIAGGVASGGITESVGLFTIAQPETGLANGSVLMFVDGTPFSGIITGVIDPDSGELSGTIDATSTFVVTILVPITTIVNNVPTTTFQTQSFSVFASGQISAEVVQIGASTATVGSTTVTPARLEGNASVDIYFQINNDGTPDVSKSAQFTVEGFKQSDVATTAGLVATP